MELEDEEEYELTRLLHKIQSMEEDIRLERAARDRSNERLARMANELEAARKSLVYIEPPVDSTIEWRVISRKDNNEWTYTAIRGRNGVWLVFSRSGSTVPERMLWKVLQQRIDEYRKGNTVEGPYLLSSGFGGGPRLGQKIANQGDR